jgi:hypothetical protein
MIDSAGNAIPNAKATFLIGLAFIGFRTWKIEL